MKKEKDDMEDREIALMYSAGLDTTYVTLQLQGS